MKVSLIDVDKTTKRIEVILPKEKVQDIREKTIDEIRKKVRIRGFRPGKVPRALVLSYYSDLIEEETKRKVIDETISSALEKANVDPLVRPIVDFIETEDGEGYVMDCEVIPELEIKEYKGIEVEVKKADVKDDEIVERLESLRNMHALIREKEKDDQARFGDVAIIKYRGYLDGKPLKEAGTDFYPLELGKGMFLPEFENAIVGMKKGEERDVEIDFPLDYPDKEVAGKRVLFKVTLKELKEKVLPELSDEFAKDLSFQNLEALKEGIKESIKKEKEALRREYIYRTVIDKILDGIEIPIPPRYLNKRIEDVLEDFKEKTKDSNLLKEEEEKLREEVERRVKEELKEEIVLINVAKKEAIEVSDEELISEIKKIADEMKRSYEEVRSFFEKNGLLGYIRSKVLLRKTKDFLIEQAQPKEIP